MFWNLKERERDAFLEATTFVLCLFELPFVERRRESPRRHTPKTLEEERERLSSNHHRTLTTTTTTKNNNNGETDDDCARFGRSSVSRRIGHRRDARFRILQTTGENAVQKAELGGGTAVENVVRIGRVLHALRDRKWSVLLDAVR